jgi:hypothetical protein
VEWLKESYAGDSRLTIRTGQQAVIDFASSEIRYGDKKFSFSPLGRIAQQLVILGGFENLIQEQLKELS